MSRAWQSLLIDRLLETADPQGAWAYNSGAAASTEPTCLALLALTAHEVRGRMWEKALAWLARTQRPDGGLPVSGPVTGPCWPTGLAALAFLSAIEPSGSRFRSNAEKAVEWLLSTRGRTFISDSRVYGHDTTLVGWPWVEGTHTWLEPTAYAILALRAANRGGHRRVGEGVRLILDRAIPGGGWNYGNRRMFGTTLRPFPATTGIALAALARESFDPRIEAGIRYLEESVARVRSPMSLSWGLIGLRAWDRLPAECDSWLGDSASQALSRKANPLEDSLLLLACAKESPVVKASAVPSRRTGAEVDG